MYLHLLAPISFGRKREDGFRLAFRLNSDLQIMSAISCKKLVGEAETLIVSHLRLTWSTWTRGR